MFDLSLPPKSVCLTVVWNVFVRISCSMGIANGTMTLTDDFFTGVHIIFTIQRTPLYIIPLGVSSGLRPNPEKYDKFYKMEIF